MNEKVYSMGGKEYRNAKEFLKFHSHSAFSRKERVLHQHKEFVDIDMILECIQAKAGSIANESVCDYLGFSDNNKEFLKSQITDCLNSYLYQEYCTSLVAEEYTNRVKDLGLDGQKEYLEYLDLLPEVSEDD